LTVLDADTYNPDQDRRAASSWKAINMGRRFVHQMVDGETIEDVFLITDKQLRANRQGNLYLQMELRDRTGCISARLWNAGEHLFRLFEEGDFLLVKGKVQLYQGALQVILSHFDRIEPEKVTLADFLPHTDADVGRLLEKLRGFVTRTGNIHLKTLMQCFLIDEEFVHAFCAAPAGVRNHHAYVGGLLEHVVNLMDAGERIAPVYPELDRDLLLTGIFLHDVGKLRELHYSRAFAYTDEGQLLGHLVIGVEMLTEKIARVMQLTGELFPQEILLRLKHMIVSHHGSYEFGSPRLPMTPEAIALHYLDNFDAKVHSFARDIREDGNSSAAWTAFNTALQRRLYKGTRNGPDGNRASGPGPDE
jgi:3'-5' exoribonuclease